MSDLVELVPADTLPKMLEEAFFRADEYNDGVTLERDDVFFSEDPGKTLVYGHATVRWDHERGAAQDFRFEVNAGTHKDDIVVFDELEVAIDFTVAHERLVGGDSDD